MGEKTAKEVRRHILEARRSGAWSKERARREWDLVGDHDDLSDIVSFTSWYDRTSIDEAWEFSVYEPPPRARAFIEKVFTRLQALLRAELAREAEAILVSA